MAVTNGWGQGVINNTNGWGKLATNSIDAGSVYEDSASGDTALIGTSAAFSYSASSYTQADADPTPTITGTTGGTFSGTSGLVFVSTSTGEIDLSASTIAAHVVTYTVGGVSSNFNLSVTAAPVASTKSMAFDGVDDFINAGSSITNLQTGDISFSAWIYPTSFSSYNYFLDSGAITTKKGIFAGLQITTGFVAVIRKTGVTDTRCTTGWVDCGLSINNWYNIVGVFDEDGGTAGVGQLKLYVNGVLKATVDGSGQDTGTGYDLHIGKSENDFSHFVGNIDEVSLYNYPLTSGNVTTIYNSGVPNNLDDLTTPPTAWYRMGENGSWKYPQWLLPEDSNKDKISNFSFEFDGVGDNINLGTSILDGLGALSISFWFNTSYNS